MEGTHMAVEFMSSSRGGRGGVVINVASMGGRSLLVEEKNSPCSAGILPMPYAPNYSASKFGIVGFTRSMTVSVGVWTSAFLSCPIYPLQDCVASDGVRVNCVCPQFTDTDMVSHALVPSMSAQLQSLGMLRY